MTRVNASSEMQRQMVLTSPTMNAAKVEARAIAVAIRGFAGAPAAQAVRGVVQPERDVPMAPPPEHAPASAQRRKALTQPGQLNSSDRARSCREMLKSVDWRIHGQGPQKRSAAFSQIISPADGRIATRSPRTFGTSRWQLRNKSYTDFSRF
jgi:hypothetical protein